MKARLRRTRQWLVHCILHASNSCLDMWSHHLKLLNSALNLNSDFESLKLRPLVIFGGFLFKIHGAEHYHFEPLLGVWVKFLFQLDKFLFIFFLKKMRTHLKICQMAAVFSFNCKSIMNKKGMSLLPKCFWR